MDGQIFCSLPRRPCHTALTAYRNAAVGVDIEGDFDLRRAALGGHDAVEAEGADALVVLRAIGRSPWRMTMSTALWLSRLAVE